MRGFEANGIGPRGIWTVDNEDALAQHVRRRAVSKPAFPLGLPDEYGMQPGGFSTTSAFDWGLDNTNGGLVDDDLYWRQTVGFSIFWDTVIGPLRFNFSHPLAFEDYDRTPRVRPDHRGAVLRPMPWSAPLPPSRAIALGLILALSGAGPGAAQAPAVDPDIAPLPTTRAEIDTPQDAPTPIVVLNQERLLSQSRYGQRIQREVEAARIGPCGREPGRSRPA